MNRRITFFFIGLILGATSVLFPCSGAIVRPEFSATGGPLLWKNRDTDNLYNRIVFVKELPFSYLALVDNEDLSGRRCYAGLNSEGFAVINTVAYNLENNSSEEADLEGIIMADALRTCKTVDDFENYLKRNLSKNLGSLANFGVIDSRGNVQLFEVSNHRYEKFDLKRLNLPYLIMTNFARSGGKNKGAGYLRFERASQIFEQFFAQKKINFADILRYAARDTADMLLGSPTYYEKEKISSRDPYLVNTRNTLNRAYTSCTILINGKNPDKKDSVAVLWVIPGEPLTAPAIPFFVEAGETPPEVSFGEQAPLWKESMRIKNMIRKTVPKEFEDYLNLSMVNYFNGGFIEKILKLEDDFVFRTLEFLKSNHNDEEYREFQNKLAREALFLLKQIR